MLISEAVYTPDTSITELEGNIQTWQIFDFGVFFYIFDFLYSHWLPFVYLSGHNVSSGFLQIGPCSNQRLELGIRICVCVSLVYRFSKRVYSKIRRHLSIRRHLDNFCLKLFTFLLQDKDTNHVFSIRLPSKVGQRSPEHLPFPRTARLGSSGWIRMDRWYRTGYP